MRQNWRDLLFVHWPVPPEASARFIPPQLELDLFDGTAYVGLVPFTMTGVRPVGLPPVWGLSSFHETNLRTYVRLGDRDPGVWFFNLDAANSIAVRLARALFHLPYHRARMFLERERVPYENAATPATDRLCRRTALARPAPRLLHHPRDARRTRPTGPPGTLDHFLVERYILYTISKDRLFQGEFSHSLSSSISERSLD